MQSVGETVDGCRPTDCQSVAPPPIDRSDIEADSMLQKRPDLADAQRRQLHGHVRLL